MLIDLIEFTVMITSQLDRDRASHACGPKHSWARAS
jgi:hypothetical protein